MYIYYIINKQVMLDEKIERNFLKCDSFKLKIKVNLCLRNYTNNLINLIMQK